VKKRKNLARLLTIKGDNVRIQKWMIGAAKQGHVWEKRSAISDYQSTTTLYVRFEEMY
jgi:hypothetical protein